MHICCNTCGRVFPREAVTSGGNIPAHGEHWRLCPGSYQKPSTEQDRRRHVNPDPWLANRGGDPLRLTLAPEPPTHAHNLLTTLRPCGCEQCEDARHAAVRAPDPRD